MSEDDGKKKSEMPKASSYCQFHSVWKACPMYTVPLVTGLHLITLFKYFEGEGKTILCGNKCDRLQVNRYLTEVNRNKLGWPTPC